MLLAARDFPPDIRVEKEARALLSAGHSVFIVCSSLSDRPEQDQWEGCEILRVRSPFWLWRKANALLFWTVRFHPQWAWAASRLVKSRQIDVLHVHDLPMVRTALAVGRRYGIPVVADFHENYPAIQRYYQPKKQSLHRRVLQALNTPARWRVYERQCALAVDRVLVVVDEAKGRLVSEGIPGEKITVVRNTEDPRSFCSISLDERIVREYRDEFVISFVGWFGGIHRGLLTVLRAMPEVVAQLPNARLLLVGDGPIKPSLERLVEEFSLSEQVTFVGWQAFEKVPSYIAASKVCLVPSESNPQTEATIPHKLFQYMLMGKPVVVSSCGPLRRVVDETGAGLVFEAGDSDSLAEAVLRLEDAALRERMGEAGRQAAHGEYDWRHDAKRLLSVYTDLAAC